MKKFKKPQLRAFSTSLCIIMLILVTGCSNNSEDAKGQLIDTQYCKEYIKFDKAVPVMEYKEQLASLKSLQKTKDFPQELQVEYDTMIAGYEKHQKGEDISKDEKKNLKAYETITLHARDNCGLYEKNK